MAIRRPGHHGRASGSIDHRLRSRTSHKLRVLKVSPLQLALRQRLSPLARILSHSLAVSFQRITAHRPLPVFQVEVVRAAGMIRILVGGCRIGDLSTRSSLTDAAPPEAWRSLRGPVCIQGKEELHTENAEHELSQRSSTGGTGDRPWAGIRYEETIEEG